MASSKSFSPRIKIINNKPTNLSGFIIGGPLGPYFEFVYKIIS